MKKTAVAKLAVPTLTPPTHISGYARIGALMIKINLQTRQPPLLVRAEGVEPIVLEVDDHIKKLWILRQCIPTDVIGIGNDDLIDSVDAMIRYELKQRHPASAQALDDPSRQVNLYSDWSLGAVPAPTRINHGVVPLSASHKATKRVT